MTTVAREGHNSRASGGFGSGALVLFRRSIRPVTIALLRAVPSPQKCGCAARKEWMIRQIESI
jgi:hypothetical protein